MSWFKKETIADLRAEIDAIENTLGAAKSVPYVYVDRLILLRTKLNKLLAKQPK